MRFVKDIFIGVSCNLQTAVRSIAMQKKQERLLELQTCGY